MKKRSKSGVRCFTRWSRKGYGAFASLGKVVKIGVLSLSMSIITLNAKSASAQPDTVRLLRVAGDGRKTESHKGCSDTHGGV